MRVLITGATGFVGKTVCRRLLEGRHELVALARNPDSIFQIFGNACQAYLWDFQSQPPLSALEAVQSVIHLAGEPLTAHRWTESFKEKILISRTQSTAHLVKAIESMKGQGPQTFLCASAVGFYGDRGEQVLDENSLPGEGFLSEVCREWEASSQSLESHSVRRVVLRFGMVLGKKGGALAKILPAYRSGLGGIVGSAQSWMSWIHEADLANLICYCLEHPEINGVLNAVAPQPVTHREFTHVLAHLLNRPAFFRVPAFALKATLGELSTVLLDSQRVVPSRAQEFGFQFQFPLLEQALRDLERV